MRCKETFFVGNIVKCLLFGEIWVYLLRIFMENLK